LVNHNNTGGRREEKKITRRSQKGRLDFVTDAGVKNHSREAPGGEVSGVKL